MLSTIAHYLSAPLVCKFHKVGDSVLSVNMLIAHKLVPPMHALSLSNYFLPKDRNKGKLVDLFSKFTKNTSVIMFFIERAPYKPPWPHDFRVPVSVLTVVPVPSDATVIDMH